MGCLGRTSLVAVPIDSEQIMATNGRFAGLRATFLVACKLCNKPYFPGCFCGSTTAFLFGHGKTDPTVSLCGGSFDEVVAGQDYRRCMSLPPGRCGLGSTSDDVAGLRKTRPLQTEGNRHKRILTNWFPNNGFPSTIKVLIHLPSCPSHSVQI